MMNLYRIFPDVRNYASFEVLDSSFEINEFQYFLGDIEKPSDFSRSWGMPKVRLSKEGRHGDFPGFIGFHIVSSSRALNLLESVISGSATYLPLLCESNEQYNLLKADKIIDCLDYSKSEILTLYDGRIREIVHGEFDQEAVQGSELFSIPGLNRPIVSERFKSIIDSNDLEGLIFKKIS